MSREYRQFCGLARALEIVGGRWTLLIVRDLLGGPKRFTDLEEGLPGIPTNVLTARLRELEEAGIVGRRLLPRPSTGVAYELTAYGLELEDAVVRLGLWGARVMGARRDDDYLSVHALSLGLRGAFRPEKAQGLNCEYELRINGGTLRVSIRDGKASFASDGEGDPDVVIDADPDTIYQLLTGLVSVAEVAKAGRARIQGPSRVASRFFEMFRLAPPIDARVSEASH